MVELDSSAITVVVSTRNRSENVVVAVKSILANDYHSFELILVDQSDNDLTQNAIAPFLSDVRLRYIRSSNLGVSKGRNLGIQNAHSEYIACTDDDCETPTNWLQSIVAAFNVDAKIGAIFGSVIAGNHDATAGFIPGFECKTPYLGRTMKDKNYLQGIGACMALRRSAWEVVNGFDPLLGAGAPLKACEDGDIVVKLLLFGFSIYQTPEVKLIHHGFRNWEQGRELAFRNWYGTGADLVKFLKCGRWSILPIIEHVVVAIAMGDILRYLFKEHKLKGITPLIAFFQGFTSGLFKPVDRKTVNYLEI